MTDTQVQHETLETQVGRIIGDTVRRSRTLTGGLMGDVIRMDFERREPVVVKSAGPDGWLTLEAEMLQHLREPGVVPVPDVLHATEDLLIVEFVEGVHLQPAAEPHCGELLAILHGITGEAYGLGGPTLNGRVVLDSPWRASWRVFFTEHRLQFSIDLTERHQPLPLELRRALDRIVEHADTLLREPERPSLLHGDIWAANVLSVGDRVTAFLDPSTCYGDPELELAYVDAWQSFGPGFWDAYTAIRPIDDGFRQVRRHVYALYPLLMHVYYFGDRFLQRLADTIGQVTRHI